ncbi:Protein MLN51-like protein [Bienertia sinuspersici]
MEKMVGDEETEYESDPEEAKMSLKMRRRVASDDEDEEREREIERRSKIVDSEGESDGQGAAAEYDDDEEEDEEDDDDEEYYDEQGEYEEEDRRIGGGVDEFEVEVERGIGVKAKAVGEEDEESRETTAAEKGEGEGEAEKKENEPFAVPTSGAFYMHDDRFRDNAGGRHRRTFGGRKLWESKDERKWGHDKFEELNTEERHYDEGRRSSRGFYRGRGKARGADRGHARGGKMRGYGGNSNQSAPPKDVRGRGPRRYQPSTKNRSETLPSHNKQSTKSLDKNSHNGSGRSAATTATTNEEHEPVLAKKVASNLNSASPPFYPSSSSNKDIGLSNKKEAQAANHNRNNRPSVVDHNFSMPNSTTFSRGKNVMNAMGMDKLHIDDSVSPANVKPLNNMHLPSSASPSVGAIHISQSKTQGRGVASSGSAVFQPSQTNNQVSKIFPPAAQASQRIPVQGRGQPSLQASGQQLVQRPLGGSQGSSPPNAGLSTDTNEPGNPESQSESGKSKISAAGKGKGSAQGTGKGSLGFGGSQVMGPGGNVGTGHGDPNLPAFFPVMQFGGQHSGGLGVPAVGMAFPGYVAQPNGLGNSEMTWLPVLASAAGALGATYCSPYLSVDGSYNPRPTGQTSALPAPSKDSNPSKPNNELKPQQRSDVANDEFSQRQNKPRRYSEMNFSQ